jgi:hypothetical protein
MADSGSLEPPPFLFAPFLFTYPSLPIIIIAWEHPYLMQEYTGFHFQAPKGGTRFLSNLE